jgi:hypothetical protein
MSTRSKKMSYTAIQLNEQIEWSGDAELLFASIEPHEISNDTVRIAWGSYINGDIGPLHFDDVLQSEVIDEEARAAHLENQR